ncbi:MAG TPA: MAC/perforin domain-containing protein [Streptosporangiaceae bacterium]|nr:MAC/perforin domain-containing protein [Streptosporangiaceae bacterium]
MKNNPPPPIPGASVVGCGFNILGTYSPQSVTSQIVSLGNPDSSTYQYAGNTYSVPQNASPIDYTFSSGSSYLYSTQEQFQGHFAQKSGVSASYGAFSGQFNLAYSNTVNTDYSYYYGIYEADITTWELKVNQTSANWLTPEFVNDPDVQALPSTFTSENQEQFFTVFRKWGTHFVAQVILGGSLDYYSAVMTSYSSSQTQVKANIELEYKAVFTSSKATSEVQWSQLGQNWANSREVKVVATGGNSAPLNALSPTYGDSDSDIFKTWSDGVAQNPSVIEFSLRPLSVLFSGAQAHAVQAALFAYTNGAIVAWGSSDYTPGKAPGGGNVTTSFGINVNGIITQPDPPVVQPPPDVLAPGEVVPIGGYQVALLDPVTYEPLMSHLYYQAYLPDSLNPDPAIYDTMMADISTVPPNTYVAVVTGFAIDLRNYPSQAFYQWLLSVGAEMKAWQKFIGYTFKGGLSQYVVVGRQGLVPGSAIENFKAVYESSWIDQPYLYTMEAMSVVLTYGGSDLSASGALSFGSLAELATAVQG